VGRDGLRPMMIASILCEVGQAEGIIGCAGAKGKRMGPEGGVGVPLARRIRRISMAVTADSDEGFHRPGGVIRRGSRGES
jgi:hypothetical protein